MFIPPEAQPRCVHLAALLLALLLTGCPQSAPERTNGTADAAAEQAGEREAEGAAFNMFAGTGYAEQAPQALDINRGGTALFVREASSREVRTSVVSYDLTASQLGAPTVYLRSNELMRAFVRAHPTGKECLLIKHIQPPDEPVSDQIWRYLTYDRVEVPYARAAGIPAELPSTARYNLEPFYSWDGVYVVVPLHSEGICIVDVQTSKGSYVPYPGLDEVPTGMACGPLPPAGDRRLAYVSRWRMEDEADWCCVNLLDLDSGEWVQELELSWIVYQVTSEDMLSLPWLVRGSRAPDKNYEHFRVPRLGLFDPVSGVAKLLQFYGDPYWPVALEPHGKYAVYLDRQRDAIVRLDPETNVLDIDPRYYDDEAQLFVAEGGERVFAWHGESLIRAEFTEQEQF